MMGRRSGTPGNLSTYGQRGGMGPNTGKKAYWYSVKVPGRELPYLKRSFEDLGAECVATGFYHERRPGVRTLVISLWPAGAVKWEGDLGCLEAVRVNRVMWK